MRPGEDVALHHPSLVSAFVTYIPLHTVCPAATAAPRTWPTRTKHVVVVVHVAVMRVYLRTCSSE